MTTQLPLFAPPAPPGSTTATCTYCRRPYVCAVGYTPPGPCPSCGALLDHEGDQFGRIANMGGGL